MNSKKMLINAVDPEESRIAVVEDGVVEELYLERQSSAQIVGNIYKGRVVNIEPSIDAAFIEFGGERNGFLHVSDVLPGLRENGRAGKKRDGARRIEDLLRPGQEILVQVTRIGIGNKGPALTTYLSMPGRYLVLMPDVHKLGVSKKIEDEEQRQRLKQLLVELNPPEDMGFIVRTAGVDQTKRELDRDMKYLLKLWNVINKRARKTKAPVLLYEESDLVIRAIRDIFTADIDEIIVDSQSVYDRVREFMRNVMPRSVRRVKHYQGDEPLFHRYKVEEEIERIGQRQVPLPRGGSIVIDETEALVAIDVNSGKFTDEATAEETAFQTNIEAAREIGRQIRLRDLGGVIVADFIDMRDRKHQREVERIMAEELKRDRARTKMLRLSRFGLLEMTRQRMRSNLNLSTYQTCPLCNGRGRVKSLESTTLHVMREVRAILSRSDVEELEVLAHPEAANYLLNNQRRKLADIEEAHGVRIVVRPDSSMSFEQVEIRKRPRTKSNRR